METKNTAATAATTAPTRAPKGLRARLERMLAGATAMPDGATIPTANGLIPKTVMEQQLTAAVAKFQAVDAQLIPLRQARLEVLGSIREFNELYARWRDSIAMSLGKQNPELAHFGLKPVTERKGLTSEQQLVRAEKARQTRKLRHTGGVRQKAALRFQGKVDVATQLEPTPPPVAKIPPDDTG